MWNSCIHKLLQSLDYNRVSAFKDNGLKAQRKMSYSLNMGLVLRIVDYVKGSTVVVVSKQKSCNFLEIKDVMLIFFSVSKNRYSSP